MARSASARVERDAVPLVSAGVLLAIFLAAAVASFVATVDLGLHP